VLTEAGRLLYGEHQPSVRDSLLITRSIHYRIEGIMARVFVVQVNQLCVVEDRLEALAGVYRTLRLVTDAGSGQFMSRRLTSDDGT